VEENLKKRLVLILGGFNILFLLMAMGQCNNARLQKIERDKETFRKLDVEEKMNKFVQDKTALEEKLKNSEAALAEEKALGEAVKKTLVQEQLVNQSLKNEIEKISKLKEALEEDLKEALVSGKAKSDKPKK
jgi:hypothetical protein